MGERGRRDLRRASTHTDVTPCSEECEQRKDSMGLTREDLLRQEALVRAREVCSQSSDAEKVVSTAERFYAFLTGK